MLKRFEEMYMEKMDFSVSGEQYLNMWQMAFPSYDAIAMIIILLIQDW